MNIHPTSIPGCFELRLVVHEVVGDRYVTVANQEDFLRHGMQTRFTRTDHRMGRRGTLRGLYVVRPPMTQDALLYCVAGEVFEAVLDLRAGSPAYHRFATFTLSADRANMLYVPQGVAHGFLVRSDRATMVYHVTSPVAPDGDTGVLWSSAGIPWPEPAPLLPERDLALPPLKDFDSPFVFAA